MYSTQRKSILGLWLRVWVVLLAPLLAQGWTARAATTIEGELAPSVAALRGGGTVWFSYWTGNPEHPQGMSRPQQVDIDAQNGFTITSDWTQGTSFTLGHIAADRNVGKGMQLRGRTLPPGRLTLGPPEGEAWVGLRTTDAEGYPVLHARGVLIVPGPTADSTYELPQLAFGYEGMGHDTLLFGPLAEGDYQAQLFSPAYENGSVLQPVQARLGLDETAFPALVTATTGESMDMRIADAEGKALEQFHVDVDSNDGKGVEARDAQRYVKDGLLRMHGLTHARHTIEVDAGEAGFGFKEVEATRKPGEVIDVVVQAGAGTLSGTLDTQALGGGAAIYPELTLWLDAPSGERYSVSRPLKVIDGKFTLKGVRAGRYAVSDAARNPLVELQPGTIELTEGANQLDLVAMPTPGMLVVRGRVVDAAGRPLERAEVHISGYDGVPGMSDAQGEWRAGIRRFEPQSAAGQGARLRLSVRREGEMGIVQTQHEAEAMLDAGGAVIAEPLIVRPSATVIVRATCIDTEETAFHKPAGLNLVLQDDQGLPLGQGDGLPIKQAYPGELPTRMIRNVPRGVELQVAQSKPMDSDAEGFTLEGEPEWSIADAPAGTGKFTLPLEGEGPFTLKVWVKAKRVQTQELLIQVMDYETGEPIEAMKVKSGSLFNGLTDAQGMLRVLFSGAKPELRLEDCVPISTSYMLLNEDRSIPLNALQAKDPNVPLQVRVLRTSPRRYFKVIITGEGGKNVTSGYRIRYDGIAAEANAEAKALRVYPRGKGSVDLEFEKLDGSAANLTLDERKVSSSKPVWAVVEGSQAACDTSWFKPSKIEELVLITPEGVAEREARAAWIAEENRRVAEEEARKNGIVVEVEP